MDDSLNVKILESYVEIDKIHDDINNKIFNFITKANELVEMSEDDYQIEKTLLLNKISLILEDVKKYGRVTLIFIRRKG